MTLGSQIEWLFVLAAVVACGTWTWTHEEIFRELHEFFVRRSKDSSSLLARKFFFALACEYCFSHYVTVVVLALTRFTLLAEGWVGYVIAGFSIVWVANIYMAGMGLLRGLIKEKSAGCDKAEPRS